MYFWTNEEDLLLTSKYQTMPVVEIAHHLNKTESAVRGRCYRLRLRKSRNLYYHNDGFFSTVNETTCYWAGLLAADGWVIRRGKSDYVFLSLKGSDGYHVREFARTIEYNGEVKDRLCNGYLTSILEVCSCPQLVKDLQDTFGIVPRKSLILQPPNLVDINHKLAFIAGYIDGDGCIRCEKGRLEVSMVGTYDVLKWVQDVFDEVVPPQGKYHAAARKRKDRSYSDYKVTGYRAATLMERMLGVETPKLKRKWDVAEKFVAGLYDDHDRKSYVKTWIDRFAC